MGKTGMKEIEAMKNLQETASTNGIHSFTAKNTLSEWLNGNLMQ